LRAEIELSKKLTAIPSEHVTPLLSVWQRDLAELSQVCWDSQLLLRALT